MNGWGGGGGGGKEKNCNLRTFSREYDCLAKIGIRKRSHCYLGQTSKGNTDEPVRTDNQKQKYMMEKKNHILLRILAVIGRYGSHLMIVRIFVTQNNF